MSQLTYRGVVENGQIKLEEGVRLPQKAQVLVVVLESPPKTISAHLRSPRLVQPEDARDFEMSVREAADAGV